MRLERLNKRFVSRLGTLSIFVALALPLLVGAIASGQEARPSDSPGRTFDIELSEGNFAQWLDHIAPTEAELDWESIPWLATFHEGIVKANDEDKPLLLWVMNGHPLGCT